MLLKLIKNWTRFRYIFNKLKKIEHVTCSWLKLDMFIIYVQKNEKNGHDVCFYLKLNIYLYYVQ